MGRPFKFFFLYLKFDGRLDIPFQYMVLFLDRPATSTYKTHPQLKTTCLSLKISSLHVPTPSLSLSHWRSVPSMFHPPMRNPQYKLLIHPFPQLQQTLRSTKNYRFAKWVLVLTSLGCSYGCIIWQFLAQNSWLHRATQEPLQLFKALPTSVGQFQLGRQMLISSVPLWIGGRHRNVTMGLVAGALLLFSIWLVLTFFLFFL